MAWHETGTGTERGPGTILSSPVKLTKTLLMDEYLATLNSRTHTVDLVEPSRFLLPSSRSSLLSSSPSPSPLSEIKQKSKTSFFSTQHRQSSHTRRLLPLHLHLHPVTPIPQLHPFSFHVSRCQSSTGFSGPLLFRRDR